MDFLMYEAFFSRIGKMFNIFFIISFCCVLQKAFYNMPIFIVLLYLL